MDVLISQCTEEFTEVEQPEQVPQCSLDTDRDGVPDYQVQCTYHYIKMCIVCLSVPVCASEYQK